MYKGEGGIYGDFIHCVKTREKPFRDIELAVNTAVVSGKRGVVLSTTDGGASWSVTTQRTIRGAKDVMFVDRAHGWAVGNRGTILRTTDGGGSWARMAMNNKLITTSALSRVSFSDQLHG